MTQPKITYNQIDSDSVRNGIHPIGSGSQIRSVFGEIQPQSGTSQIPYDSSLPQVTEGTQIGVGQITREYPTSNVLIQFNLTLDSDTNATDIIVAVFRENICIASIIVETDINSPKSISMTHVDDIGTGFGGGSPELQDGPVTYSGRVGTAAGTETWYVNDVNSGNDLGGSLHTWFVLTELK